MQKKAIFHVDRASKSIEKRMTSIFTSRPIFTNPPWMYSHRSRLVLGVVDPRVIILGFFAPRVHNRMNKTLWVLGPSKEGSLWR